jgi:hypothetical protein
MKNSVNLSIKGLVVEELPSPASLIALKDIYNGTSFVIPKLLLNQRIGVSHGSGKVVRA